MKKLQRTVLKMLAASLCLSVALTGCGGTTDTNESAGTAGTSEAAETGDAAAATDGGTIMWMAHMNSGAGYESYRTYMEALCKEMGYDFTVVYGDSSNSASGNLDAVRNGMTDDVVGLVASMDGGLNSIMEEYPELYVVGAATDMRSVYGEGGESAACLEKDHFLGTIAEGYCNGAELGEMYAQQVIDGGYKKVKIIKFPDFAYPTQAESDAAFRAVIEEYNQTAAEPIEIVGETITLQFTTLPDSFFLEEENEGLDCIVAMCSGTSFVYPTVVTAKANGTCDPDLKVITVGFNDDPSITADTGDDGTLASVYAAHMDAISAYAILTLDNAIRGQQYSDFEPIQVDSQFFQIDTQEKVQEQLEMLEAMQAGDLEQCSMPLQDAMAMSTRNNPEATQAQLIETIHSLNAQ